MMCESREIENPIKCNMSFSFDKALVEEMVDEVWVREPALWRDVIMEEFGGIGRGLEDKRCEYALWVQDVEEYIEKLGRV